MITATPLEDYKALADLMRQVPTVKPDTVSLFANDLAAGYRSVTVGAQMECGAWLRIIAEAKGADDHGTPACTRQAHDALRTLAGADVQTSVNGSASAETAAHHIADMVRAKLAAQEAH